MATIELIDVAHRYTPDEYAVRDVNLTWQDGVAAALLGPSGSGKTTVLKIISGLLRPSEGRVLVDGRDVTDLPARERNVAQVFQFPVVYETLDVYGNLAFPLRNQGLPKDVVRRRVEETAKLLDLEDVLRHGAARLGASEQQRVSLGRGIVRDDISAVLLDEPLTVIDPQAKGRLRRQIKALHARVGMTMIYVTHDQHEALTFADQVTVMDLGEVVQTGSPQELHEKPAAPFVGYFIGSPGMNLFDAQRDEEGLRVGGLSLPLSKAARERISAASDLQVGVRPEFVQARAAPFEGAHEARVRDVDMTGRSLIARLELAGLAVDATLPDDAEVHAEDSLWVRFPPEHLNVYSGGRRLEVLA